MTIQDIRNTERFERDYPLVTRERERDLFWMRYVEPHISKIRKPLILDVGCLYGDFLTIMPKNIMGIEVIPQAVDVCKKRNLNAVISDLKEKLPFQDNSFDLIHCWAVVEHLTRDTNWNAFREFYRVLKPDGKLIVMTGDIERLKWKYLAMSIDHQTPFSKASLKEIVELTGFRKHKINHLHFQRGNGLLLRIMSPRNVMRIQDFYKKIGINGSDLVLEAWK